MSESRQSGLPLGATPGKLALIGVLALVMIGVVASNWPSDETAPADDTVETAEETAGVAPAAPIEATAPAATGPFGEFAVDQHWPERPMKEVTGYDPLVASEWMRPAAVVGEVASSEDQIDDLLAAQSAIIFVAGNKRFARIGDKEFQVGDVLGRYTISDITAKGVLLNETE